jgi:hypothetical protein
MAAPNGHIVEVAYPLPDLQVAALGTATNGDCLTCGQLVLRLIHAHQIGDLLVVRLEGVLTATEQQLVKPLSAEKGRDLLKQVPTHLIETARPMLGSLVHEVAGVLSKRLPCPAPAVHLCQPLACSLQLA